MKNSWDKHSTPPTALTHSIVRIRTQDLNTPDALRLSYPLKPQTYAHLAQRLPLFPLTVVNAKNDILFGLDYYHHLLSLTETPETIDAIQLDIDNADGLILAYNLKTAFTGVNLYEKLNFIHLTQSLLQPQQLYQLTDLDITVNPQLLRLMPTLLSETFMPALTEEAVSLKAAKILCNFKESDQPPFLELFRTIPFTNSHQLKLLEMAEELIFRDKCPLWDIFQRLEIHLLKEENKPQKAIIDAFFKERNPIYHQTETQWQTNLKELKLPPNIRVTHYPFFEKRQLEINITADNENSLLEIIKKLKS